MAPSALGRPLPVPLTRRALSGAWCPSSLLQSDKDTREDIQKVFNLFDDDQTGHISLRNLKRVAKELGETMSDAELMEMIERADTDGDGEISPDEFYAITTKKTFT